MENTISKNEKRANANKQRSLTVDKDKDVNTNYQPDILTGFMYDFMKQCCKQF